MDTIDIKIKNCNNIEEGQIKILKNKLNIKYGINGTGKSSLAKAIEYYIKKEHGNETEKSECSIKFANLKPYKNFENEKIKCEITGLEDVKSLMIFNNEYVSKFLFKKDDLIENSFEIFIKHDEYDKIVFEINELFDNLKKIFSIGELGIEITNFVEYLDKIVENFGKSTKNGLSKSSKFVKALENGNNISNIKEEIKEYSNYIKNEKNASWLKWHSEASNYKDIIKDSCPYCISNIKEIENKFEVLKKEYNPTNITNLNIIIDILKNLSKYFSDETKEKLTEITGNIEGISLEQNGYLGKIQADVSVLIDKISNLKNINYEELKKTDNVDEVLKNYKVDLKYIESLKSVETIKIVDKINKEIDNINEKARLLQGLINKQNARTFKSIQKNKESINEFLKYSGIKYYIEFIDTKNNDKPYKMLLKHNDISEDKKETMENLSYGERNAFSLALFMYDCVNKNPDIIILDDPISSFDTNKKFAIIEKLFKDQEALYNKTTILFTHDFDNVLNMIYIHHRDFSVNANFLDNCNGILNEKEIKRENIKFIIKITEENIVNADNKITPLIYLRRKYEIYDKKNEGYNLLSSLFKKRENPSNKEGIVFDKDYIKKGVDEINIDIQGFDYSEYYKIISNNEYMLELYKNTNCRYEKLQIYRIINLDKMDDENKAIKKFINQTYHIENDYLFQLNPVEYQTVPCYVIEECDKELGV